MNFIFLIIASFFALAGFQTAHTPVPSQSVELKSLTYEWSFTQESFYPNSSNTFIKKIKPVWLDRGLINQIFLKNKRIKGFYEFSLKKNDFLSLNFDPNQIPTLYFPAAGGIKKIQILGQNYEIQQRNLNYHSGVLVPLTKLHEIVNQTQNQLISVRIDFEGESHYSTGIWRGAPILGPLSHLIELQKNRHLYLSTLPFSFSVLFLSLSFLFGWIGFHKDVKNPIYKEYALSLFLFGIYYLFLSGFVHHFSPKWATLIHLPLRMLATGSLIHLFSRFIELDFKKSKWIIYFNAATALAVFGLSFLNDSFGQTFLYLINQIIFLLLTLYFGKKIYFPKNHLPTSELIQDIPFYKTIFFISLVVGFCFLSDALQLVSKSFNFAYPFQNTDRFMTPFLLLTSILYLVRQLILEISKSSTQKALEGITQQVSHDLKSPILALKSMIKNLTNISTEQKRMFDYTVERIQNIAEDLIFDDQKKKPLTHFILQNHHDFISILKSAIQEKNSQWNLSNIFVELKISEELSFLLNHNMISYHIDIQEFKRVLSNLLNNAFEAMIDGSRSLNYKKNNTKEKEKIYIHFEIHNENMTLTIQDFGKGIPLDIISKIGKKGFTHKKLSGLGLGLHHAIQTLKKWDSQIIFSSDSNSTHVKLIFSKNFFKFTSKDSIHFDCILIDDDPLIRILWKKDAEVYGKKIKIYSDPRNFIDEIEKFNPKTPVFIDSDLRINLPGEKYAELIYQKGFKEIYLITALPEQSFKKMPWIKKILGKEPSFLN